MSAPPDAPAPDSSAGWPPDTPMNWSMHPRLPKAQGDAVTFWVLGLLMIGLCVGLMSEAPGILVVLLVLATPALIRTIVASSRQTAEGRPASGMSTLQLFISSLGVITLIGLASIAAFYATCLAVCFGALSVSGLNHGNNEGGIMFVSVGAGLAVGLWVAVRLIRRYWSRKGKA